MLKQFLLDNWEDLVKTRKPRSLGIATLSSCNEEYGNDLLLLFVEESKTPQYVLKVVRDPHYNFKLERENSALTSLSTVESIRDVLPVSFSEGKIKGRYFFIQGGITGRNLNNIVLATGLNEKTLDCIEQSIHLLGRINLADREFQGTDEQSAAPSALVFSAFLQEKAFVRKGISNEDFTEIAEYYDYFCGLDRSFFLHGDYWPANILVNEKTGKVNGIIDWEFSNPHSVIPSDIIWFLINFSYTLFGHLHARTSLQESFLWGFFTSGEHNEVFKKYFQLYMSKIAIRERQLFKPLLLLTLASMSMREKIAYGSHNAMDNECLELLKYALKHESYMESL